MAATGGRSSIPTILSMECLTPGNRLPHCLTSKTNRHEYEVTAGLRCSRETALCFRR